MDNLNPQFGSSQNLWAVVLAGGCGTRLAEATRGTDGVVVPKQYCTFWGQRSLLEATLDRLEPEIAPEHTVVVVAAEHRKYWSQRRHQVPAANFLEEPTNRGTAMAVLLALLFIRRVDRDAVVIVVPADHGVRDEQVFQLALRRCLEEARQGCVIVLGMQPDSQDDGYGWIVPGESLRRDGHLRSVARFIEKPTAEAAESMRTSGALWSSFVLAGRLGALLALIARARPGLFGVAATHLSCTPDWEPEQLANLYSVIPKVDLSRDVLQTVPDWLWVAPVEPCGWTDLGTPERLRHFLNGPHATSSPARRPDVTPRSRPTPSAIAL